MRKGYIKLIKKQGIVEMKYDIAYLKSCY